MLILEKAEEVFLEKGYYDTSMEEIAARVGIAKGTIYLHFARKDDLVVAIIQRDLEIFLNTIDAQIALVPTAREKLEVFIRAIYSGLFSKHTYLLSNMYNAIDIKRMIEEKQGCLRGLWEGLSSRVTYLLDEGKEWGEFDKQISTITMLRAFFALFTPRSYIHIYKQENPEEIVTSLIHIYFRGIAAPSPC
ncbi:TetR/AcrR family transcriptional regulator [Tengunoibacter tsumagoiensis]|nr:TetR/AcrR family transcriptional regulator [Tengunoibacter tsumagoiensis]